MVNHSFEEYAFVIGMIVCAVIGIGFAIKFAISRDIDQALPEHNPYELSEFDEDYPS